MKPIIFVFGLSGVGKTYTAKKLSENYSLLHIDIDRKNGGFAKAGFPSEWDKDISQVDFALLTTRVRVCIGDQHQGAVLSFPTTYRFKGEQLCFASTLGVGVILLWGTLEQCFQVRRERQKKNKGTTPEEADYLRKNRPTFEMYEGTEYDKFKVAAFQSDGSRPLCNPFLELVMQQLANQGIKFRAK